MLGATHDPPFLQGKLHTGTHLSRLLTNDPSMGVHIPALHSTSTIEDKPFEVYPSLHVAATLVSLL